MRELWYGTRTTVLPVLAIAGAVMVGVLVWLLAWSPLLPAPMAGILLIVLAFAVFLGFMAWMAGDEHYNWGEREVAVSESLSSKLEGALFDVMEEHFGERPVEMWSQVPMLDLYEVQAWLWGHHADVLAEWTRRKMQEASPV